MLNIRSPKLLCGRSPVEHIRQLDRYPGFHLWRGVDGLVVDEFRRDFLNVGCELLESLDTATRRESADRVPETSVTGISGVEGIEAMRQEAGCHRQAEEVPAHLLKRVSFALHLCGLSK